MERNKIHRCVGNIKRAEEYEASFYCMNIGLQLVLKTKICEKPNKESKKKVRCVIYTH